MPHSFPHTYKVSLTWDDGSLGTSTCNNNPPLKVGPPPQFDGPDNVWSPEDMLLSSIQTCFMTTFFSLATRRKLNVSHFESEIRAELDKTKEGLVFTTIEMDVTLQVDDEEKADRLLHMSDRYCIITNTLNIKPVLHISFQNQT